MTNKTLMIVVGIFLLLFCLSFLLGQSQQKNKLAPVLADKDKQLLESANEIQRLKSGKPPQQNGSQDSFGR